MVSVGRFLLVRVTGLVIERLIHMRRGIYSPLVILNMVIKPVIL